MNPIVEFLCHRRSSPILSSPAPGEADLELMFNAALAAPDHGQLQPYRFRVFQGEALARLGDIYAEALKAGGESQEAVIERARGLPLRAPMVIVAIAHLHPGHPKAPESEQRICAALACLQMMQAATALGYGVYWRTGELAYLPEVGERLGLQAHEAIIGFIYCGTPSGPAKPLGKALSASAIWRYG
jgi:nitroreductase